MGEIIFFVIAHFITWRQSLYEINTLIQYDLVTLYSVIKFWFSWIIGSDNGLAPGSITKKLLFTRHQWDNVTYIRETCHGKRLIHQTLNCIWICIFTWPGRNSSVGNPIACSTACSCQQQEKTQAPHHWPFVRGNKRALHRWPVGSLHKGSVMQETHVHVVTL